MIKTGRFPPTHGYMCNKCDAEENDEEGLMNHMKEVHNEVAKNFVLLSIYFLYEVPELNWAIINEKI
jgi:hypothetical protein